jgi:hypothetical protein
MLIDAGITPALKEARYRKARVIGTAKTNKETRKT